MLEKMEQDPGSQQGEKSLDKLQGAESSGCLGMTRNQTELLQVSCKSIV